MTNYDAIKQLPVSSFANMVFHIIRNDVSSEIEFEELLNREVKPNLEDELKEALQNIQCPSRD